MKKLLGILVLGLILFIGSAEATKELVLKKNKFMRDKFPEW